MIAAVASLSSHGSTDITVTLHGHYQLNSLTMLQPLQGCSHHELIHSGAVNNTGSTLPPLSLKRQAGIHQTYELARSAIHKQARLLVVNLVGMQPTPPYIYRRSCFTTAT